MLHEALAPKLVDVIRERGIGTDDRIPSGRDLQRLFGVSRETVSRAIDHLVGQGLLYRRRGRGFFLARPIDALEKGSVALLFGKWLELFADPIWSEPHGAILSALQDAGHEININTMDGLDGEAYISDLHRRLRKGLIITANIHDQIASAASSHMPVVGVRDCLEDLNILWSCCDNRAAAEMAVEHLVELGHRRIGYSGSMISLGSGRERLDHQRAALKRRGLALPRRWISGEVEVAPAERFGRTDPPNAYWVRRDLLDGPDRPTAVICASIGHADNLLSLARAKSLRIPEDLSAITLVDKGEYAEPDVGLTAVQTMTRALGENAVRLVREAMSGTEPASRTLRAAPEMRLRASTAAPPEEKS